MSDRGGAGVTRERKTLTALAIAAEKPGDKRREIPDGKIGGLYLVVQPSGAKSWAFRYRVNGQSRKLTIGSYPAIDLAAARKSASHAVSSVANEKDPVREKREARAAEKAERQKQKDTVRHVVDTFIAQYVERKTRPSSAAEVKRLLRKEAVPYWGDRSLASITKADVRNRLRALVEKGAPVMANRFLGAFRKMCNWAIEEDILSSNPCQTITAPTVEISRDRILSDEEMRVIWRASGNLGWPFGPIVRLLILTGQRRGEVAEMHWSEVDLDQRTWTIPKERAKNGKEHIVPLSVQAIEVFQELPTIVSRKGLVFTITGVTPVSGFTRAKNRLDELAADLRKSEVPDGEPIPSWVLHDLRRTVASGLARLGINLPVIEKILNHISGSFSGIVAVYQRHSFDAEKRSALDAWGRHVDEIAHPSDRSNVVEIRA